MFLGMVCRPRPRLGRGLAAIGMQPNFQAFVGSLWARCAGHVRDVSRARLGCRLVFRHFMAISWIRCAAHVKVGTKPNFQIILSSFVDKVRGYGQDATGTHPDFQFLGHSMQAMSRTRLGCGKDAA
ncbi:Hypothetical predicted protein [Olea europaea subsp. europaea]|uniref:Uncharacterized protein n=1 Tax=Olea europaea subsp. europaea TaxID=158383 RepID=A0A8S0TQR6_OLEEU|nr:Hypothetical predicted protein [Olea europaea subsp. europaea]